MKGHNIWKDFVRLSSGNLIAQAITLVSIPIIAKHFSPSQYGIFALYLTVVNLFSSLGTGRMEFAILATYRESFCSGILQLGVAICLVVCSMGFILSYSTRAVLNLLFNISIDEIFILACVLTVVAMATSQLMTFFLLRHHKYQHISLVRAFVALSSLIAQLFFLYKFHLENALIWGFLLGQISGLCFLTFYSFRLGGFKLSKRRRLNRLMVRYKSFPLTSSWSIAVNQLAQVIPMWMIGLYAGNAAAGLYSFAQRVVSAPSALTSGSLSQIVLSHASKEKRETGKARVAFKRGLLMSFLISCPFYIGISIFPSEIIEIMSTSDWKAATPLVIALIPISWCSAVIGPISGLNNIFERQGLALCWQIGLGIISIGSFINAIDVTIAANVYSILSSIWYGILLIVLVKVANNEDFISWRFVFGR